MKLLCALCILCGLNFFALSSLAADASKESTLDRVTHTKILRCGHMSWEPYLVKDLATGEVSGITYDYLNAVAKRLGLTIDWTSEVNVDQIVPSIEAGKIDLFCLPCSPVPEWEKRLDFIGGFGSLPYFVYTSAKRELGPDALKTARFTVVDGYIPSHETPIFFPEAKISSLPQTTSMAELYDQIKYDKADAVINEHLSAALYMKNNPGVIRKSADSPVVLKPMSFPAMKSDVKWASFINTEFSTEKPENKKLLQDLMVKYNLTEDVLLFPAPVKVSE